MYRNIFGVCKDVGRGTFFQWTCLDYNLELSAMGLSYLNMHPLQNQNLSHTHLQPHSHMHMALKCPLISHWLIRRIENVGEIWNMRRSPALLFSQLWILSCYWRQSMGSGLLLRALKGHQNTCLLTPVTIHLKLLTSCTRSAIIVLFSTQQRNSSQEFHWNETNTVDTVTHKSILWALWKFHCGFLLDYGCIEIIK